MAIRAFITNWSLVNGSVTNPILDHLDTQPDMGITLSMIYPDANADGLPDKPLVLVMAESDRVGGGVLESLKNLAGVTLIPGARHDKHIATLPPSAKADIDGLASAFKIPASVVTGSTTMSDLIGGIEKYICPNSNGVAHYLATRPAEFG